MKPTANYLLVAVPERFVSQHTPGQKRLVLPSGSDDWKELDAQIRAGEDVQIETDETPIPVCQGTVLMLPERLTEDMMLCAGPHTKLVPYKEPVLRNGKTFLGRDGQVVMRSTARLVEQQIPRTAADITHQAFEGDTIHFDEAALSDESEVSPGVYLVGYADVIAIIATPKLDPWHDELPYGPIPIAGYVLLTRVWAADVVEAEVEGRMRKVRYVKQSIGAYHAGAKVMIEQVDVPPLNNEGIVAWHSAPLRGTVQEAFAGDHVIIDHRFAREETIGGVQYLAVRQDYVMAVREPNIDRVLTELLSDETFVLQMRDTRNQRELERLIEYGEWKAKQPPRADEQEYHILTHTKASRIAVPADIADAVRPHLERLGYTQDK